jgi:hypothetical protein
MGEKLQSTVKKDRATSRMPRRAEVLEKAIELFHQDRFRNGDPSFINPTEQELKENGHWQCAVSELMRDGHRSEIESDYVDFPEPFTVDLKELFQSNGLILGSRHTGKSDVGMFVCNEAMKEGAICYVLDPSKDWLKRSSVPYYTENLAITEKSTVFDISLLCPNEQRKTVERFCKELFEHQVTKEDRKQVLLVFEESQTYFYQGSMKSKDLENCVRCVSVGRNFDVACLLISQFASALDKFLIKHSISQSWYGFSREPNDIRYLAQILGDSVKELPKLNDGEFLFLNRKGIQKIGIEPYTSQITKQELKPTIAKIEPFQPIKTIDTSNALARLAILIFGFALLLTALGQMI